MTDDKKQKGNWRFLQRLRERVEAKSRFPRRLLHQGVADLVSVIADKYKKQI